MRRFAYLPYLVLFAALGLFAYQNQEPAGVNFAVWQFPGLPFWLPVAVTGAAFVVIALIREPSRRR